MIYFFCSKYIHSCIHYTNTLLKVRIKWGLFSRLQGLSMKWYINQLPSPWLIFSWLYFEHHGCFRLESWPHWICNFSVSRLGLASPGTGRSLFLLAIYCIFEKFWLQTTLFLNWSMPHYILLYLIQFLWAIWNKANPSSTKYYF